MNESILTSIKKNIGIEENYTHFDLDLITHINSVFSILTQMGVGPESGFQISGSSETWGQFMDSENECLIMVKSYVYLKVRLIFDPPISSSVMEAINRQISEMEWRLFVASDNSKALKGV